MALPGQGVISRWAVLALAGIKVRFQASTTSGVSQSRVYALVVRSFHLAGGLLPVKTASECVSSPYLFFQGTGILVILLCG